MVNIKPTVAITQTKAIEENITNALVVFFSFLETGGLDDVKSFKLIPYKSARQSKI